MNKQRLLELVNSLDDTAYFTSISFKFEANVDPLVMHKAIRDAGVVSASFMYVPTFKQIGDNINRFEYFLEVSQ